MGRSSVSESIKWQIIGMYKCGNSYRAIQDKLGVSKTCVGNVVKRFQSTGTVIEAPWSGRPKKTSPRQDRKLLMKSKKNQNNSASDLLSDLKREDSSLDICVSTVSSRLR